MKFYRILPCLFLCVALSACGGGGTSGWSQSNDYRTTSQATKAPEELIASETGRQKQIASDTQYVPPGLKQPNISRDPDLQDFQRTEQFDTARTNGARQFDTVPAQQYPPRDFVSNRKVKIGIILPLSGPSEEIGQSLLNAAQLALFDVGAPNLELIPADTRGTQTGAKEAAQKVMDQGAEFILGPLFGQSVKATQSQIARAGLKQISFTTDWSLASQANYVMGFLPFSQVERILTFARNKNLQRLAIIAPNTAYGQVVLNSAKDIARNNQLTLSRILSYSPTNQTALDSDLQDLAGYDPNLPQTAQNINKRPDFDAVLIAAGGDDARRIAARLSEYGLPPETVIRLGTGLWDDPLLAANPEFQNAFFAAPDPRARKDFERNYLKTYGTPAPRLATLGYDATALAAILAIRSLNSTGNLDYSQAAITATNGFAGVDGLFRFQPNGLVERRLAVLRMKDGLMVVEDPANTTFVESQNTRNAFR